MEVHVKEDYSIFQFLHPKPKNNKRTLCKSSLQHSVGEDWPTIYIISPPTNSSQPQTFPSKEPVDNSHSVVVNSLCKSGFSIPIKQTMYLSSQMNVSLTHLRVFRSTATLWQPQEAHTCSKTISTDLESYKCSIDLVRSPDQSITYLPPTHRHIKNIVGITTRNKKQNQNKKTNWYNRRKNLSVGKSPPSQETGHAWMHVA